MATEASESLRRWRLILGQDCQNYFDTSKFEDHLHNQPHPKLFPLNEIDLARDRALEYLYQREHQLRGQQGGQQQPNDRQGGLHQSQITPVTWLAGVRKIFPKSTVEILQNQAINRYQLHSLLSDIDVLKQATPDLNLVQTLLSFKNHLSSHVMSEIQRIIQQVCQELENALLQKVTSYFSSRRLRHLLGGKQQFSHLDWSSSIRRNLKNYHPDQDVLLLERLFFYQRQENKIPWELYLLIDQSGSMLDSVIHTAVLAAIFCRIRALNTHLILFDTAVVDLSGQLSEPVETLLSVQMGGGTDIGNSMSYLTSIITQPSRSLVVLISDFEEGPDPQILYQQTQILQDSGVTLLGLASLGEQCDPVYNEAIARQLSEIGMHISAMTPDYLAAWVAEHIGMT